VKKNFLANRTNILRFSAVPNIRDIFFAPKALPVAAFPSFTMFHDIALHATVNAKTFTVKPLRILAGILL